MIETLKSLFAAAPANEPASEQRQQLAAAALLVEMSRADYTQASVEHHAMLRALETALSLSRSEVEELVTLAAAEADKATSLYEFTSLINEHYSPEQKLTLIESMWRVAYADSELDKYEERLIRQVADLVYVSHKDFIRLKLKVAQQVP